MAESGADFEWHGPGTLHAVLSQPRHNDVHQLRTITVEREVMVGIKRNMIEGVCTGFPSGLDIEGHVSRGYSGVLVRLDDEQRTPVEPIHAGSEINPRLDRHGFLLQSPRRVTPESR